MRFVDTNVFLYAISDAPDEKPKRDVARELLNHRDLATSSQVLGEFYVQATRQTRTDALQLEQARRLVTSFTRFHIEAVTTTVVLAAMASVDRHQISYWDACVIEAARQAGCSTLLTEDLQDGMDFAGVAVHNPFAAPSPPG